MDTRKMDLEDLQMHARAARANGDVARAEELEALAAPMLDLLID